MKPPPLIVFDLDDTLYLERDYARSGYDAVARIVRAHTGVDGFGDTCLSLLDAGKRVRIFDEALEQFGLESEPAFVAKLVEAYRSHRPEIRLASDAEAYLASRPQAFRGALLTDGLAATQEAKIRALGLEARLQCIICTGRLGPGFGKPHPRPFEMVEAWAGSSASRLVYVADNPLKDFVTPKRRGWGTVQIRRPERIHRAEAPDRHHEAHASIAALDELDSCLDRFF